MASHRLVYFDGAGRAEATRLAFHIGGIEFEDVRLTGQQFGERKQSGEFLFGQLPVLYVNGEQYCQSSSILRYAGKLAGIYPQDPLAALKVDMLIDCVGDLFNKVFPVTHHPNQEERLVKLQELATGYLPFWLQRINGFLVSAGATENAPTYFVNGQLSTADLVMLAVTNMITNPTQPVPHINEELLVQHAPLLIAHKRHVLSHERVASYYASRA